MIELSEEGALLLDIRTLLAHMLMVSTCPDCMGTGVLLPPTEEGGRRAAGPCPCRVEARAFVMEQEDDR